LVNIIGNNFASLYLAYLCHTNSISATIYTDGMRLGGHFSGVIERDHILDLGMVCIEKLQPRNTEKELERQIIYNEPLNCVESVRKINCHIDKLFNPNPTHPPLTFYENKFYPDFFITDRLDILDAVCDKTLKLGVDSNILHPKNKHTLSWKNSPSYEDASNYNHGATLHNSVIKPFLRKMTTIEATELSSKYHRALWLPLYWRETIKTKFNQDKCDLEPYQFYRSKNGSVASVVRNIELNIRKSQHVKVDDTKIKKAKVEKKILKIQTVHQSSFVEANSIGLSTKRLFNFLSIPFQEFHDFASISIAFVEINSNLIKSFTAPFVHVVDENIPIYRISISASQTKRAKTILTLEMTSASRHTVKIGNEKNEIRYYLSKIFSCAEKDFEVFRCFEIKNAIALPTQSNLQHHEKNTMTLLDQIDKKGLTGNLVKFDGNNLNEQIFQANTIFEIITNQVRT